MTYIFALQTTTLWAPAANTISIRAAFNIRVFASTCHTIITHLKLRRPDQPHHQVVFPVHIPGVSVPQLRSSNLVTSCRCSARCSEFFKIEDRSVLQIVKLKSTTCFPTLFRRRWMKLHLWGLNFSSLNKLYVKREQLTLCCQISSSPKRHL